MRLAAILTAVLMVARLASAADEPVFSGPQAGEKLAKFKVRGVFDADAGKELDFVAAAAGKPIVLVFVHDVNRQSIGMTRVLTQYTVSRAKDGLATGVVWLDDDVTAAEAMLKRVRHALAPNAPTGISVDGREGPGSYGLNRNVMLTILIGKDDKVTANYALIQPSLQADLPKVLQSVVDVAGGTVPKLEELAGMRELMQAKPAREKPANGPAADAPNLRPLMAPVIRRNATDEDVDKAAQTVEKLADKDEAVRREVGRIAQTIVGSGKLGDYGTPRAQEFLRKWATKYGSGEAKRDAPKESQPPHDSKPDAKPAAPADSKEQR